MNRPRSLVLVTMDCAQADHAGQAVIISYAVSGLIAFSAGSCFGPTGGTLGLVLAVLGTGIWIGVPHLGYIDFGEIRGVAQRTMEQRHIFMNNLAITEVPQL